MNNTEKLLGLINQTKELLAMTVGDSSERLSPGGSALAFGKCGTVGA